MTKYRGQQLLVLSEPTIWLGPPESILKNFDSQIAGTPFAEEFQKCTKKRDTILASLGLTRDDLYSIIATAIYSEHEDDV